MREKQSLRVDGRRMLAILLFWLALIMPQPSFSDVKFRIRTTGRDGTARERVVYIHGQRIRTEMPNGRINIRQCDLHQFVRLNDKTKTFRVLPILEPPADLPPDPSQAEPAQCRVTPRRVVEDTGESQPMFGITAEHIRFWIYLDPVPGSCPSNQQRPSFLNQVRDGWYIEVPDFPECPARTEKERLALTSFAAPDRYVRPDGSLSPILLPAKLEVKVTQGQQMQTEFREEMLDFSTDTLDRSLFEIPAGYAAATAGNCAAKNPIASTLPDGTPVYDAECITTAPKLIRKVEPEYSEHARKKKINGTVVLSMIIDPLGDVHDIKVDRSLEPSLDEQAIKAVSQWKFAAGMKDGQSVTTQLQVEITFSLYR